MSNTVKGVNDLEIWIQDFGYGGIGSLICSSIHKRSLSQVVHRDEESGRKSLNAEGRFVSSSNACESIETLYIPKFL